MRLRAVEVTALRPGDRIAGTTTVRGAALHVIGPQPLDKVTLARREGRVVGHNLYYLPRVHGHRKYQQSLVPLGKLVLVAEEEA